jgi:hypothetical protein
MGAKAWGCCGGSGTASGGTFACTQLGGCSINALGDVDTGTTPPAAGNTLVWNGTAWIPGTGGGGSGLTAVATQDTPTVDLSGDGTPANPITAAVLSVPAGVAPIVANDTPTVNLSGDGTSGSPITADVIVAPEPNGLEAAGTGLLVAPSADAGNALTVGSDGRLYATSSGGGTATIVQGDGTTATVTGTGTASDPYVVHSIAEPDTTVVAPVAGSGPAPVGTGRSVDIDVTEGPADTFNVGARLSPQWADGVQTFTATEAGVYEIQQTGSIGVQTTGAAAGTHSASIDADHRMLVNGTPVKVQELMVWGYDAQDINGTTTLVMGPTATSNTITKRILLNVGDVVTGDQVYNGIPNNIGVSQPYQYELSLHKISD